MNQTPTRVVYIVVFAISILSFLGTGALALSLFYKTYADPAILTALISITSTSVGSLGTILVSTNSRQTSTPLPDTLVKVTNSPDQPVPTAPQQP